MEDKNFLSKIIKEICNENLIPLGVFQKGNSRLYLDDNGYFFTVIEFQPSSWTIGTYLNIGLTFLWNQSDALCFAFSRQLAARYGKFVEYKNEAQFRAELKNPFQFFLLRQMMLNIQFRLKKLKNAAGFLIQTRLKHSIMTTTSVFLNKPDNIFLLTVSGAEHG